MKDGKLILTKAAGEFKHPVPLADGVQQYVTGKTSTALGKETATGKMTITITSSLLSDDPDEQEALLDAVREAAEIYTKQWKTELNECTDRLQKGKTSLFDLPTSVRKARPATAGKKATTAGSKAKASTKAVPSPGKPQTASKASKSVDAVVASIIG